MTQGTRLSAEVRAQALVRLGAGQSVGAVARDLAISKASVSGIASRAGLSLDRSRVERIVRAAKEFDLSRRLELLNRAAEVAEGLLETDLTPSQLRDVVISLAVLVDKRRLDMGEATQRVEAETVHVYLPRKGSIESLDACLALPQLVQGGTDRDEATDDDEAFPAQGGPRDAKGWQE